MGCKPQMLDDLCDVDMALRELRRFLREAAGRSLSNGLKEIGSDDLTIRAEAAERRIGFV